MTVATEFLRRSLDRLLSLSEGFGEVDDDGVMGVLRESLIESFLEPLLMPPYRAGTGVITDSKGNQSGQCDVIIWDDSIFRPLYSARGAGIYLIESVVAAIEVKSTLEVKGIRQAIEQTRKFKRMVIAADPEKSGGAPFWVNEPGILPLTMIFGFRSKPDKSEADRAQEVAAQEGIELGQYLQLVCVPHKDSWVFPPGEKPRSFKPDQNYNEVLMPFAGILNSFKLISQKRGKPNLGHDMVP